jgi:hypothetical protein
MLLNGNGDANDDEIDNDNTLLFSNIDSYYKVSYYKNRNACESMPR